MEDFGRGEEGVSAPTENFYGRLNESESTGYGSYGCLCVSQVWCNCGVGVCYRKAVVIPTQEAG